MRTVANSMAVLLIVVLAGCAEKASLVGMSGPVAYVRDGGLSAMLALQGPEETSTPPGVAPAPFPPQPYGSGAPGQPNPLLYRDMRALYPWSVRVSGGAFMPDASTLEASPSINISFVSYQGPYSLEVGVGFYQMQDNQLGGRVSVTPITVGGKIWMETYPGSVKSFFGIGVGPYVVDHSEAGVTYSTTVGVDFMLGLSLETEDRTLALGCELGYTINRPSITVGSLTGDDNLNGAFFRASIDLFF